MDKKLKELVDLFKHNKKQYKRKHYDEANTRTDFIDNKNIQLVYKLHGLTEDEIKIVKRIAENKSYL